MKHICSPNCIYYPLSYSEIIREFTNEYGLKEREAVYLCGYDEHRITKFDICKNYKAILKGGNYE